MKNTIILMSLFTLMVSCGQNKKTSHIYDYEDILTVQQERSLDARISKYQRKTDNQILVVTSKDIDLYQNALEYALFFGNDHGLFKKGKNNGLVIFVSDELKRTALATGNENGKSLKDDISKQIIDSCMIPHFEKDKYFDGIKLGIEESIKNWD